MASYFIIASNGQKVPTAPGWKILLTTTLYK